MTLDDFIQRLATDLSAWTKENGGQFHVARDPLHPYVILAGGNYQSFVVILNYAGADGMNTDQHPHGMRDAKVEIFVGHGMDLRSDPGAWLFKSDGSAEPILKRLDALLARVLTIAFDNGDRHDKAYAVYGGEQPATLPDGAPLKAFKATVSWPLPIDVRESDYRFLN